MTTTTETTIYQTTTEYRTHWIDAAGRRYERRYPFCSGLIPVVNLDEVRAWIDLGSSADQVWEPDATEFYARQFLREDLPQAAQAERDRLAPVIAGELTDEVPRYHYGIRAAYIEMRSRWPMPQLTGYPIELRNLTPHAVTIGEVVIQPSGTIARATEESTPAEPLRLLRQETGSDAHPAIFEMVSLPTTTTRYTGLVDLPDPQPGVYLIVSMVIPPVARVLGRWTGDLLTPGQQVRDSSGRVIGCRSLDRVAP